ncbi:MAG TPA: 2-amino-4-hydroxy-6-hydroxymethyldihydropteridine diphosphokinase [Deltaproteobacteria bacterium]|nr:2-amino-4-hydroxy-6-hydroxymethyldihydropteridine diphosphokinase [Deltaproteobacteria bacterium]
MRGYLSLGSNLGDRLKYLKDALDSLARNGVRILLSSSIYETKPVDVPDKQSNYFNMVVSVETAANPEELLRICLMVEKDLGRQRPYVHAPRTIDIDIILLDGISMSTDTLTVPHPRMEQRSFVIIPLAEIAPDIVLPSGRPIIDVKKALSDDEVVNVWALSYG